MEQADPVEARWDLSEEILNALPDGVALTDAEGRIAFVNGRMEDLTGYTRADLIGTTVEMLVPERLRATHRAHRAAYEAAPRHRPMGANLQTVVRRRDGTEIAVAIALSPINNRAGRFVISAMREAPETPELLSRVHVAEKRQRIARELHEGVVHSLFAVGLELHLLARLLHDEYLSSHIHTCIAAVDDCIVGIRKGIHELAPPSARDR